MKKLLLLFCISSVGLTYAQCPTASFSTSAPECKNQNISFNNTSGNTGGGWNYSWDFDLGGNGNVSPQNSNNQNPNGIQYNNSGTYSVSLTITGNGCPATTATMLIDVEKARADFGVSGSQICLNETVTFTNTGSSQGTGGNSTVTHLWDFGSGANPATSTQENPPAVTYLTTGAKNVTHYVTVNYPSCGKTKFDQVSQTIFVNPKPIVSFTSTAPVCEGSSANFTYTGSTSSSDQYTWDFGASSLPSVSTTTNPTNISYSTSGIKNVTLTVTNQYGCFNTVQQNITINSKPTADFSSNAPQCTGLSVDFLNTGTTGINYDWDFGPNSTPGTSTSENPSITFSTQGARDIRLIVDNGNCKDTMFHTINIYQTPSVSFTSTTPQCANSGIDFSNTGATGSNWQFLWDFGQDGIPNSSTAENPTQIKFNQGGTKLVTLVINDQHCTNTFSQTISVDSLPIISAGLDTTICANLSVQIGETNNSNLIYSWFPSNSVVIDNPTISNPTVSPISQTTNYILTATDINSNCYQIDSVEITMLPSLIADAGIDVEICRYDTIQIGASLIEGQIYTWSSQIGLTDSTISSPLASPDSTTIYTLSVTDDYGCPPVTDDVLVTVNQLPLANAGIDDSITVNNYAQLVASGGVQYSWWPETGLNNSGINNPMASPDSTTQYIVKVIDIYGCIQTDTMTLTVITPSFWIPTAFSPDGDTYNDVLYVRGDGINDFDFTIYDSWGHLIFRSQDITIGWDGTYMLTGEQAQKGAYVFHVSGLTSDGKLINESGMVNLIR
jgi:gliding motility-associated-like protein